MKNKRLIAILLTGCMIFSMLPTLAFAEDEPEIPVEIVETTDEPTDGSVAETTDETTDAPTDAPVEEPVDEIVDEPVEEPSDEPVDEIADEPAVEPEEPEAPEEDYGISLFAEEDGVEEPAVAEVGGQYFASLKDAIAAATEGDTVKVLADLELSGSINPGKAITIEGVNKADGSKPVISGAKGLFSITKDSSVLKNLELRATGNSWYIYHSAGDHEVKLTVDGCDFTMAEGVTNVGNLVMTEGTKINTPVIFTNNNVKAHSRAALAGPGNGTVITGNVFDLISETYDTSRTGVIGLTAMKDAATVTITNNIFKNANRVLGVDNSYDDVAEILTFKNNAFIDCHWALEFDSRKQEGFDLAANYYSFNGEVGEAKIEDASKSGSHTDGTTAYAPTEGQVKAVVSSYYTRRSEDGTLSDLQKGPDAVAEVEGQYFASLQTAITAAKDGDTVTLLMDVNNTELPVLKLNGAKTLDLNGYEITSPLATALIIEGGTVTVKNGSVSGGSNNGIYVKGGAKADIQDVTVESGANGIYVTGASAVDVQGGSVSGTVYGVKIDRGNNNVTLSGVTVKATRETSYNSATQKFDDKGWGISITVGTAGQENAKLKIEDCEIYGSYSALEMGDFASVTVTGENTELKSKYYGVIVWGWYGAEGPATTFTMEGGKILAEGGTITGSGITGNGSYHGSVISLTDVTVKSSGAGIYHPQLGSLTVEGGSVTGSVGIQMCAGSATVKNAAVTGTGEDNRATKTGDSLIEDGAAISVVDRDYPGGVPSISIEGGVFSSAHSEAVLAYSWDGTGEETWDDVKNHVAVAAGTFSSDVTDYCVPGTKWDEATHGIMAKVEDDTVAIVGNRAFATLQAAIAAAADGNAVKLLADVDANAFIDVNKSITIEGGNHTVNSTASRILRITESNVTVTLNNIKFVSAVAERGVQVDSDKTGVVLNINGCTVPGTSYAVNMCSNTNVALNIADSTISGWGALNLWGNNYEVKVTNSTLKGHNDKSYSAEGWNGFGVVVLEGDTTGQTDEHVSNCHVVLENCHIIASTEVNAEGNGNVQKVILFNNPSTNNLVEIIGDDTVVEYEQGEFTPFCKQSGSENELVVSGGTFSGDVTEYRAAGYVSHLNGDGLYHVHREKTGYGSDSTGHWSVCSAVEGCLGVEKETQAHTFGEWVTDAAAQVGVEGSRHQDCTLCGYRVTETIPALPGSSSSGTGSGGSSSGSGGGGATSSGSGSNARPNTSPEEEDLGEEEVPLAQPMLFADVTGSDWYHDAVRFVFDRGIMKGMDEKGTVFAPNLTATRGMIVTMLYRLEEEPEAAASAFTDVTADDWYTSAVNWASANGVVKGYEDGSFRPNGVITRQEMAVILARYARTKGVDMTVRGDMKYYNDKTLIASWAQEDMAWAVGVKLMQGKSGSLLDPTGTATRAEIAQMLKNFCEILSNQGKALA